ncbi:hypothetical protein ACOSQ3_027565 [Xanthoceras sorbifolium]
MNTDAALDVNQQLVGIGVVIHNHFGQVLGSSWQPFFASFSPAVAATVAVHRGLIFPTDASFVVGLIVGGDPSFSYIGLLIQDILFCLKGFPNCKVSHVSRIANSVAHRLAKLALLSNDNGFLVDNFPTYMESLILADTLG